MNLTTSLLAGLLLLLPGLTALGAMSLLNLRDRTRRPEAPLTALNTLLSAMVVSLAVHVLGVILAELAVRAAAEWNALGVGFRFPPMSNPYLSAAQLASGSLNDSHPRRLFALICIISTQCAGLTLLVRSRGFSVGIAGSSLQGAGWAWTYFAEPLAHGYLPVAYVMMKPIEKGRGVSYAGAIEELRLGEQGEVRGISLRLPQRSVWELRGASRPGPIARLTGHEPVAADVVFSPPTFVEGMVSIAAADIHNLLIRVFVDTEALRYATPDAPGDGA